MIRKLVPFLLAAALAFGVSLVCQAESQPLMTRHMRETVVSGQAPFLGRLPASQSLRFDVVLALRHQPELDSFLKELYDPSSPSYRQFVTVEQFAERFGPSQEDYDAFVRFAQVNGLKVVGGSLDAMDVHLKGSVLAIEKAFHITMGVYKHPTENRTFFAPDREPTVDLPFQLWHISGLDNYSIPHPLVQRNDLSKDPNLNGSCGGGGYYCGSDMRAAYYGGAALTGAGQTIGLLEFYGYDIADLNNYFSSIGQTDNVPVVGISTDGSSLQCNYQQTRCDDAEQTLDMTQAISMAPGLTGLYVYVGSSDTAVLSSMSTHSPLDAQLSSSWDWYPADPSTDDPYFKKFAAQGQSFFQAAGDDGAYDSEISPYFYPAEDAYVTAVGGTDLLTASDGGPWSSEGAWLYGGGGYFAPDHITIPAWQKTNGVITAANEGSTKWRNVPDVAAEANFDFYVCADGGCGVGWGGTSFAAPMWAGYMALINQQAVANGNPLLGFINPAIYRLGLHSGYAAEFHDITTGNNDAYGQTPFWTAGPGYDLVTGWGSPNGAGLINMLAGSVNIIPEFLQWGTIAIGKTSTSETITVTNTGNDRLNIGNIAVSGDFSVKSGSCRTGKIVATGAKCTIIVVFKPTAAGARTGDLTISDNANDGSQQILLYGTGQ